MSQRNPARSWRAVTHDHRQGGPAGGAVARVTSPDDPARDVNPAELGERLSALRLCDAAAIEATRRSLERHGQLEPVSVFADDGRLEILDGFKRVRAARALAWPTMRARVADVDAAEAKLRVVALHDRHGLTELEEGWVIRSLYHDHHLSQPTIAARLGRHKSWVVRRLLLVEALEPSVQADVRLGLLAPRAAVALGQLPRGNQPEAAGVVIRRGLTVRQTELFVSELNDAPDDAARAAQIASRLDGPAPGTKPGERPTRPSKSEIDGLAGDIRTLRQVAGRLEGRLSGGSLLTIGPEASALAQGSLLALLPLLGALARTIHIVCGDSAVLPNKDAA